MSTIIAVASGRGGSGKTTVAAALGFTLTSVLGVRTALVDLDSQGSLATYLGHARALNPLTDSPRAVVGGMALFAGGAGLGQATVPEIMDHIARAAAAADVTVVDCPPDLTSAPHTAVFQYPADLILGVGRMEPGSVNPLASLLQLSEHHHIPHLVLPNIATGKANAQGTLIAYQAIHGDSVTRVGGHRVPVLLPYQVPATEYAGTAITQQVPLTKLRPNSSPARQIVRLAEDLRTWGLV